MAPIGFGSGSGSRWNSKQRQDCWWRRLVVGVLLAMILLAVDGRSLVAANLLFGFTTSRAAYLTSSQEIHVHGVKVDAHHPWLYRFGTQTCLGLQGDPSDCAFLAEQVLRENRAHELIFQGRALSTHAIAHYCRSVIARKLRSEGRLRVNALVAGWNGEEHRPVLYWLDEVGSLHEVPHGAHGREFMFLASLLDQELRCADQSEPLSTSEESVTNPKSPVAGTQLKLGRRALLPPRLPLSIEEGLRLSQRCWQLCRRRFPNSYDQADVCVISEGGSEIQPVAPLESAPAPLLTATTHTTVDAPTKIEKIESEDEELKYR